MGTRTKVSIAQPWATNGQLTENHPAQSRAGAGPIFYSNGKTNLVKNNIMMEQEGGRRNFATTRWTMVVNARDEPERTLAGEALEALCQAYWYPLYAFARRKGLAMHDAQDRTQGFFARLIEKGYLQSVDRSKGRFRCFLMASFTNYLADQRKFDSAMKRGGGIAPVSLDAFVAEGRFDLEPPDEGVNPEVIFDRAWAKTLLDRVLRNYEQDCRDSGKGELFVELKGFLIGLSTEQLKEVAQRLDMSESNVRVTLHRMRKRFAELFRQEVAQTVARPEDLEEEMQALLEALT